MSSTIPGHDDACPCSPQDTRIMLRILLSEALRYHKNYHGENFSREDWQILRKQIEEAWEFSAMQPSDRYLMLKNRLTTLFLWDCAHEIHRDLDEPPMSMMRVFSLQQQRRLDTLPPGQLFHSPQTSPQLPPSPDAERYPVLHL